MTIHEAARLRAAIRNERENSKALAEENMRLQDDWNALVTSEARLIKSEAALLKEVATLKDECRDVDLYAAVIKDAHKVSNDLEARAKKAEKELRKLKEAYAIQALALVRCENRECM